MKPTLLILDTNKEVQADVVLDHVGLRQGVDWRHPPGRGAKSGPAGFVRAGPQQVTLTLGFDSDRPGAAPTDVRAKLRPLDAMTAPDPKTGRPPRVLLTWGEYSVPVVVDAVEVQYGRCVREGFPTRAVVTLRATESRGDPAGEGVGLLPKAPVAALTAGAGAVTAVLAGAAAALATARKVADRAVGEVKQRAKEVRGAVEPAVNELRAELKKGEGALKEGQKALDDAKHEAEKAVKQTFADLQKLPDEAKQKIDAAVEELRTFAGSLYGEVTKATAALEQMAIDKVRGAKQLGDRLSAEASAAVARLDEFLAGTVADLQRRAKEIQAQAEQKARELEKQARAGAADVRAKYDEAAGALKTEIEKLRVDAAAAEAELRGLADRVRTSADRWQAGMAALKAEGSAAAEQAKGAIGQIRQGAASAKALAADEMSGLLARDPPALNESALGDLRAADAEARAQAEQADADLARARDQLAAPLAGLEPKAATVAELTRTARGMDGYLSAAADEVRRPPAEAAPSLRRLWPRP